MPRYEIRIVPFRNDGNGVLHEAIITINAESTQDADEIGFRYAQMLNGVVNYRERV